jgi:hypothetical protein
MLRVAEKSMYETDRGWCGWWGVDVEGGVEYGGWNGGQVGSLEKTALKKKTVPTAQQRDSAIEKVIYGQASSSSAGIRLRGFLSHDGNGRKPPGQICPTADRHGQAGPGDQPGICLAYREYAAELRWYIPGSPAMKLIRASTTTRTRADTKDFLPLARPGRNHWIVDGNLACLLGTVCTSILLVLIQAFNTEAHRETLRPDARNLMGHGASFGMTAPHPDLSGGPLGITACRSPWSEWPMTRALLSMPSDRPARVLVWQG